MLIVRRNLAATMEQVGLMVRTTQQFGTREPAEQLIPCFLGMTLESPVTSWLSP